MRQALRAHPAVAAATPAETTVLEPVPAVTKPTTGSVSRPFGNRVLLVMAPAVVGALAVQFLPNALEASGWGPYRKQDENGKVAIVVAFAAALALLTYTLLSLVL